MICYAVIGTIVLVSALLFSNDDAAIVQNRIWKRIMTYQPQRQSVRR